MKRLFTISLVMLLLLGLLAGCGAKSESAYDAGYSVGTTMSPAEEPEAAPMETVMEEEVLYDEAASETGSGSTALPENQKLIRTVNMDAETLDLDPLMAWIENQVASLGGYFEQKSIRRSGSRDDGSYYKYADLMIRIPAQNLDQFTSQVGEEANVTSTSESTENVTLTYVSTKSRVEALETEQKRLLELLEEAASMEDLLTIEARLTDVRWELENYASQLRVLDNKVDYSTVYLSIWEVDEPTVIVERTVWQKIGDGFTRNAGRMWNGLVDFFIWLLTVVPYLVPMTLIGGVALLAFKLGKKLNRKKKAKKTTETEEK